MNDILKEVKGKYRDIHIDKQSCPSYVKMFTKDNNQIVLVYAEVTNNFNTERFKQKNIIIIPCTYICIVKFYIVINNSMFYTSN